MAKSKTTEESGELVGDKGAGRSPGKAAGRTTARAGSSTGRAPTKKVAEKQPPKKAPAKKAATGKAAGGTSSAGGKSGGKAPDLKKHLKDFASGRPQGWTHDDWESFLGHLRTQGHDTSNADAIGLALERERLSLALQQVEGLGPRRIKNLAERFTTVWSLRHADVEAIAEVANVRRDLAERIKSSV
ncbi:hypothetical protein BH23GEM8_BH23GEM8_07030 [soil metagenome]